MGKKGDRPLSSHSSGAEVVLSYLRGQVAAIARYDPLVRTDEPDAVHQMRVASRRARSALQAFGDIIDKETTRPLCEDLKWLAVTLGQARDAEVMLDRLNASLALIQPDLVVGPVEARVSAHFTPELARTEKIAMAALDGRRYRRLRDHLDELLVRPQLTPRAGHRAGKVLSKPVRRTGRRLSRALAAASEAPDRDAALHEARKAAKRARYAAEAAMPALGSAARGQAAAAEALQEVLGDHHDSVVVRAVLLDLAGEARAAGEDTFTYGLMYQHQADWAASMEHSLPPFAVETFA